MESETPTLTEVSVRSFGCLRDVTLGLEPLTVLVGPNDSGKTTLLRAIEALGGACRWHRVDGEPNGWSAVFPSEAAFDKATFGGSGGAVQLGLRGRMGSAAWSYETKVYHHAKWSTVTSDEELHVGDVHERRTPEGISVPSATGALRDPSNWNPWPLLHGSTFALKGQPSDGYRAYVEQVHARSRPLSRALEPARRYLLRPEELRRPMSSEAARGLRQTGVHLTPGGFGLARALDYLLRKERDRYEAIERSLRAAMPFVARIDIDEAAVPGTTDLGYSLEIVTKSGARASGDSISDGVLLYLGYLYLAHTAPGGLLLIEEPETGVHPSLMRRLVGLLRSITNGELDVPPTQVLLTTHSPLLLNEVRPEEIQVFSRSEGGATSVTPFTDAPDLARLLDFEGPGEVWVNEGEGYITGARGVAAAP